MTEIKIYKILSYILLIPNAFFALIAVLSLLINPFAAFFMSSVVIYTIYAFIFLQKTESTSCWFGGWLASCLSVFLLEQNK